MCWKRTIFFLHYWKGKVVHRILRKSKSLWYHVKHSFGMLSSPHWLQIKRKQREPNMSPLKLHLAKCQQQRKQIILRWFTLICGFTVVTCGKLYCTCSDELKLNRSKSAGLNLMTSLHMIYSLMIYTLIRSNMCLWLVCVSKQALPLSTNLVHLSGYVHCMTSTVKMWLCLSIFYTIRFCRGLFGVNSGEISLCEIGTQRSTGKWM